MLVYTITHQTTCQVREGEIVFGVAHIFASFNDTFVHVTDLSGSRMIASCLNFEVTDFGKVSVDVVSPILFPRNLEIQCVVDVESLMLFPTNPDIHCNSIKKVLKHRFGAFR